MKKKDVWGNEDKENKPCLLVKTNQRDNEGNEEKFKCKIKSSIT